MTKTLLGVKLLTSGDEIYKQLQNKVDFSPVRPKSCIPQTRKLHIHSTDLEPSFSGCLSFYRVWVNSTFSFLNNRSLSYWRKYTVRSELVTNSREKNPRIFENRKRERERESESRIDTKRTLDALEGGQKRSINFFFVPTLFEEPLHRSNLLLPHLFFTTCMTTCIFLERYFDREAYSVIKIRKRNKMLTKITLEVARSKNVLVHLRPSSKLWARILQHFQMYTCTSFLLLCLPKALRYHLTVYKHVCMVGNASISANRRILCGFTHIQVCCVRKGLTNLKHAPR